MKKKSVYLSDLVYGQVFKLVDDLYHPAYVFVGFHDGRFSARLPFVHKYHFFSKNRKVYIQSIYTI